jgi:hypothetical protein
LKEKLTCCNAFIINGCILATASFAAVAALSFAAFSNDLPILLFWLVSKPVDKPEEIPRCIACSVAFCESLNEERTADATSDTIVFCNDERSCVSCDFNCEAKTAPMSVVDPTLTATEEGGSNASSCFGSCFSSIFIG